MSGERLSPERLAEIRRHLDQGYTRETLEHDQRLLLAEIGLLTDERRELLEALATACDPDVWTSYKLRFTAELLEVLRHYSGALQ